LHSSIITRLARRVGSNPASAATLVATLALSIGTLGGTFALAYSVLVKPLPFPSPEELVAGFHYDDQGIRQTISFPEYEIWRSQQRLFAGLAAATWDEVNIRESAGTVRVRQAVVSDQFFQVLGITPLIGRVFIPDDVRTRALPIVLTESYWRRAFNADVSILGRLVQLDNNSRAGTYEIIGIARQEQHLTQLGDYQFYVPMTMVSAMSSWADPAYLVVGRLRKDVSISQASLAVNVLALSLQPQRGLARVRSARLIALHEAEYGHAQLPLVALVGSAAGILALACLNVTALLLITERQRVSEYATRTALGATRTDIARQVVAENGILVLVGGLLAVPVMSVSYRLLQLITPAELTRVSEQSPIVPALAVTLLATASLSIIIGMVPAFSSSSRDPWRHKSPILRLPAWHGLAVFVQVVTTIALLFVTALLVHALYALSSAEKGFRTKGLVGIEVTLGEKYWSDHERYGDFLQQLEAEASSRTGVAGVALVSHLPTTEEGMTRVRVREQDRLTVLRRSISPNYIGLLGIPLARGTGLTWHNRTDGGVLINETLHRLSRGAFDVGTTIRASSVVTYRVIGVVKDTREWSVSEPPRPMIYDVFLSRPMSFWVMAADQHSEFETMRALGTAVSRVDSSIPVSRTCNLERYVSRGQVTLRFLGQVLSAFTAIAVVLVAVGLWGAISSIVIARTKEAAVRTALGARPAQLAWTLARPLLIILFAGTTTGVAVGIAVGGLLRHQLHGIDAPGTLLVIVVGFVVFAFVIEAWRPLYRLATITPAQHLRDIP
jgi:putative ABC transport system permease protein